MMKQEKLFGCHDSVANFYDERIRADLDDYIRENYFEILDKVIDVSSFQKGYKVLDIGIGTGLLTEKMPDDLDLYGIDISEMMMKKIKEKNLPVKLKKGSFLNIPFEDRYFERIVSTFAFHHLNPEEKEKAYIEMNRVLKPSGFIVIGDFMFENELQKKELIDRFISEERDDMLEEFDDEYFTFLNRACESLNQLGYNVEFQRGSTISWILKAVKKMF